MLPRCLSRLALALLVAGLLPALARCESADDYRQQAMAAMMKKETDKALTLADKAIAAAPKDTRGYLVRAAIREAMQKHTEAVADYSKCLELDPRSATAYNRRGAEQFKRGRIKESLADFDRFLELEPKAAPSHWMRGISLYYAGRFDEGRKQFKAGDQVFANDVENAVWHFLCNVHVVGIDKAREAILKIGKDTRVPMMEVYDLYRGKVKPADVMTAAEAGDVPAELRKEQLFYAHLYLGLYYDATSDKQKALKHLTLAEGKYRIGHYMGDVAHVHAELLRKEEKK